MLHHNSGKTALLVLCVVARALREPDSRHAIFRFRLNALIASVVRDTLPKMIKLKWPGLWDRCKYNGTENFLTLPNSSEIWFSGLDDKDRTEKILGMEFATIYFNECSQIPWASVTIALTRLAQKTASLRLKAYYDFNPPSKTHWTYLQFVRKLNPETKRPHKNEFDYSFYLINPGDNRANLDKKYIDMLDSLPEKARNRFLLGRFADESDGALWTEELLAQQRLVGKATETLPEFQRIIVAIDPSGCSGPEDSRSDEVGITVGALGTDGKGYLLEDLSGRHSPEQWSHIANSAFERHNADMVVAEKNFGGDMVRAVLQAQNVDLPFKEVTATRGKVVRAEPISALYEQQKIWHVGYFTELEDQLCGMTTSGYQGLKSPDRGDACLVAGTQVTTLRGQTPIERVNTYDKVLTRKGWFKVKWAGMTKVRERVFDVKMSDGTVVTATAEHPFLCNGEWKSVDTLVWGDIIHHIKESEYTEWPLQKSPLRGIHTADTQIARTRASNGTMFSLQGKGLRRSIAQCGSFIMERSPKITTSITETGTGSITTSPIWNVWTGKRTERDMPQGNVARRTGRILSESDQKQLSGTDQRKGENGTERTEGTHGSTGSLSTHTYAPLVGSCSQHSTPNPRVAVSPATTSTSKRPTSTIWKSPAQFVRSLFGRTNTSSSRKHAPVYVVRVTERSAQPVYNLHVDGPHEFFANGVLVHNCIWLWTELFPGLTKSDKDKNWTPPPAKAYTRKASRYDRR